MKSVSVQRLYLALTLLSTLAASFIWGVNTLFLLDAGLTNAEAFAANALFTAGQVIFEVPTGIVADTWGRRTSYLLGTVTLCVSTLLYLYAWQVQAPFWIWGVTSALLGLGFTFFSGATEAWLVDALAFTGFKGTLESVFSKGQVVSGVAMLVGSVSGGFIAQMTDLGVPYILRAIVLMITCIIAFLFMKDIGFNPKRSNDPIGDIKKILATSVKMGFGTPSIKWIMLEAPFSVGVSFYIFYAMQPYLLELYGDSQAYGVAGLAAAIVAGAQIIGGLAASRIRRLFRTRTAVLLVTASVSALLFTAIGLSANFVAVVSLLIVWGLLFAVRMPVRQAYLNDLIPSKQRATILSFDSLVGSSGGVVIQPVLGRAADMWSYPGSYLAASAFQLLSIPFILLARRLHSNADRIADNP